MFKSSRNPTTDHHDSPCLFPPTTSVFIATAAAAYDPGSSHSRTSQTKPSFFSALRETLAKLDVNTGSTATAPLSSTLLALSGSHANAYSALNRDDASESSQDPESSAPSSSATATSTTITTTTPAPMFSLNAFSTASLRAALPVPYNNRLPSFSPTTSSAAAAAAAFAANFAHPPAAGSSHHGLPRVSAASGDHGSGSSGNGNSAWFNTLSTASPWALSWGHKARDASSNSKPPSSSAGVRGFSTGNLSLSDSRAGVDGGDGGFSEGRALEQLHAQQRISNPGTGSEAGYSQGDGSRPAESYSR